MGKNAEFRWNQELISGAAGQLSLGFFVVNAGGLGIDNFFGGSDLQKITKYMK